MIDERTMPDWLPQGSARSLPEGTRRHGSTGQLFEVQSKRWVRIHPDACEPGTVGPPIKPPGHC